MNFDAPFAIPSDWQLDTNALRGRVILITGATGTLGRVAAHAAVAAGATVVLHGRHEARLNAIYDALEAEGANNHATVMLDLAKANEQDYRGLAETVFATYRRLDGIVHAASHIAPLAPITMQDLAAWQAHTTVNTHAPLAITRACWPMLKRAQSAQVVFLGEHHALKPQAWWGAYATSKAALGFAVNLWQDEIGDADATRLYWYIPGPVASQSRSVTHPGEMAESLPAAPSLSRDFTLMLAGDARLPRTAALGPAKSAPLRPASQDLT
jgi:NAD(P)-dependent dehydrogenase (short-subunit alcohol dehydrogenase family)